MVNGLNAALEMNTSPWKDHFLQYSRLYGPVGHQSDSMCPTLWLSIPEYVPQSTAGKQCFNIASTKPLQCSSPSKPMVHEITFLSQGYLPFLGVICRNRKTKLVSVICDYITLELPDVVTNILYHVQFIQIYSYKLDLHVM